MRVQVLDDEEQVVEDFEVNDLERLATKVGQDELGHRTVAAVLNAVASRFRSQLVPTGPEDDLLTIRDVATMCDVQVQTVHRWRLRDRATTATMPKEAKRIADRPLWDPAEIIRWCIDTERYVQPPRADFPVEKYAPELASA